MQEHDEDIHIYILRHGETDWNKNHWFQGQVNTSLNKEGRKEARQAEAWFRRQKIVFDCVYSSPIARAMETVEIVTGLRQEQIIQDKRLMEMKFGILDGTPFDTSSPLSRVFFEDPIHYIPPENAESFADVDKRVRSFFEDLRKKKPGKSILIGSHGCCMRRMMVCLGALKEEEIWQQKITNCTVVSVVLNDINGYQVVGVEETSKEA